MRLYELAHDSGDPIFFSTVIWHIFNKVRYLGYRRQEYAMERQDKIVYYLLPLRARVMRAFVIEDINFLTPLAPACLFVSNSGGKRGNRCGKGPVHNTEESAERAAPTLSAQLLLLQILFCCICSRLDRPALRLPQGRNYQTPHWPRHYHLPPLCHPVGLSNRVVSGPQPYLYIFCAGNSGGDTP